MCAVTYKSVSLPINSYTNVYKLNVTRVYHGKQDERYQWACQAAKTSEFFIARRQNSTVHGSLVIWAYSL